MYSEYVEFIGIVKKNLSFEQFKSKYFVPSPEMPEETVPDSLAWDFYTDFINSRKSFKQYVKETVTSNI